MDVRDFVVDLEKPQGLEITKAQAADAIKDREIFLGLVTHPGWQTLCAVAKAQIENRRTLLELPGDQTEDGRASEFLKGEIMGLRTLVALPDILVENWEAMIEAYRSKHDGEEDGSGREE